MLIRRLQAKFSADKESLIEDAIRENRQTFTDMPTLGDLRWTVVAITQVLRRYELFRVCLPCKLSVQNSVSDAILQANCWFMVSLIQECLGEVFFGCLAGRFIYTVLGDTIRRDIMATARLIIGFPHLEAVRIFKSTQYLQH